MDKFNKGLCFVITTILWNVSKSNKDQLNGCDIRFTVNVKNESRKSVKEIVPARYRWHISINVLVDWNMLLSQMLAQEVYKKHCLMRRQHAELCS